MLTDDERAALERLRPIRAGGSVGGSYGSLGISNTVDAIRNYQRDCYTAIDLTLREHPADEGEPASIEWLVSIGGLDDTYGSYCFPLPPVLPGNPAVYLDIYPACPQFPASARLRCEDGDDLNIIDIACGDTRGDVYRLLGALGIGGKG